MKTHALKTLALGFAALCMAASLHAQTLSINNGQNITVYANSTKTFPDAVQLTGWDGSNVVVYVDTLPSRLTSVAITPSTGTATTRDLTLIAGAMTGSPESLFLKATESPYSVNNELETINVTVRPFPDVSLSAGSGFHDGHVHTNAAAILAVTKNASADTLVSCVSSAPAVCAVTTADLTSIALSPKAVGTASITLTVRDSVLGGVTNAVFDVTVRDPFASLAGPELVDYITKGGYHPITGNYLGDVTNRVFKFAEDTTGRLQLVADTCYTVAATATTSATGSNIINFAASSFSYPDGTNAVWSIVPHTNAYGLAEVALRVTAGGLYTKTTNILVYVENVPDAPVITGLPDSILISTKAPLANLFAGVSVTDPDDFPAGEVALPLFGLWTNNLSCLYRPVFTDNGRDSEQKEGTAEDLTTWAGGTGLKPRDPIEGAPIGSTNRTFIVFTVTGVEDGLSTTVTIPVDVWFENTPPSFTVNTENATISEGESKRLFTLSNVKEIDPPDQTNLTLRVWALPGSEGFGAISGAAGGVLEVTGSIADIGAVMMQYAASAHVMTNLTETLRFCFELSDGHDSTVQTNTVTLLMKTTAPEIYIGSGSTSHTLSSDALSPLSAFTSFILYDADEGAGQTVRFEVSGFAPYLTVQASSHVADIGAGTVGTALMAQGDATAALRSVAFLPDAAGLASIPLNTMQNITLTLTAFDRFGLSATRNITISITKVNGAPVITVPAEAEQPILFAPDANGKVYPFTGVGLLNDDTNNVTFRFRLDDAAKGTFGGSVSNMTAYSSGYQLVGPVDTVLAELANVTFTPSASYPFPVDQPGGTVFTFNAIDDYSAAAIPRMLAIVVQNPPRNWMVTRLIDDGAPGSLSHALKHFDNNDIITFALPEYPATLRLTNAVPVTVMKALTIKGPGSDLLVLSGDTNGNGTRDRTFLEVAAPLTIEGLTLEKFTGQYGGAISVVEDGALTLRDVTIQDCEAEEYGGAVDVYLAQLTVDGCRFLRNVTAADTGLGGGALSIWSDQDVMLKNTIFAENTQRNPNGYGGGAIYAQFEGSYFLDIDVVNCTFTGNADATWDVDYQASSIFANAGSVFYLDCNLFADDPAYRTLNTDAVGEIWSYGGNTCDDEATVFNQQLGQPGQVLLLYDATDKAVFDPLLDGTYVPQNPATPRLTPPAVATDIAGRIRPRSAGAGTLSGAVEPDGGGFPAITEIQLLKEFDTGDRFIEIYAPRGGGTVDLTGMTLLVNSTPVHVFGEGLIAYTNSGNVAGTPAAGIAESFQLEPGCGVVVVFPRGDIAGFQTTLSLDNPTPIVRGSVVTNAAGIASLLSSLDRGSVSIAASGGQTVVHHTFLAVYNDPESPGGINVLDTVDQSIATVPQAAGFAFLPHKPASPNNENESPGATSSGETFGGGNALPVARDDVAATGEDDPVLIDVLANDYDADNDPLSIVIVDWQMTSTLGSIVTYDPDTCQLLYDPIGNSLMQALPSETQLIDTFEYAITDGSVLAFTSEDSTCISVSTVVADLNFTVELENVSISNELASLNDGDTVWLNYGDRLGDWAACGVQVNTGDEGQKITLVISEVYGIGDVNALIGKTFCTSQPVFGKVTVTVNGMNDNPVGADDLNAATLTEREAVRIMAQPDLSATPGLFTAQPTNAVRGVGLLANDWDIDRDSTNTAFRITGVLSGADVHPVTAILSADSNTTAVITSPAHGLAAGDRVVIVGVNNPARLNGAHTVTAADEDTFTIATPVGIGLAPISFVDAGAYWIPSTTARDAVSPLGAAVTFSSHSDRLYENIVYNAAVSEQLQALAEGESVSDGFWYVFHDGRYDDGGFEAPAIAYVSVTVEGVNNPPDPRDDPPGLEDLPEEFGDDLADILTNRLAILTVLVPSASGAGGQADVIVADKEKGALTSADLILLENFYATDEDTLLTINAAELFANDSDIDTNDLATARHYISRVESASLRGAFVEVGATGTNVIYNPQHSAELQALGIDESLFDLFTIYISDGHDEVASRVAVLVRGVNDRPTAYPVCVTNLNPDAEVTFTPIVTDVDVNDVFADVTVAVPEPDLSTNLVPYTITDHSLFLALDDTFRVEFNAVGDVLDVLANDVNFHGTGIRLISVTPSLRGGVVEVNADGSALLYTPPADFAGNDLFTYSAVNELGVVRKANVRVRVIKNGYNGLLLACDDEYAVARGMTFSFDPRVNDVVLPGSPDDILVDPAYDFNWPDELHFDDPGFTYIATAPTDRVTFRYRVTNAGNDAADSYASVTIKIIDRYTGIQPDWFTAAPGAAPITLDLLSNDVILGDSTDGMLISAVDTTDTAGAVVIADDSLSVTYAAPAGFIGVDIFTYTAVDRYGAQGKTNVYVTVGVPFATSDSIMVATNTVTLIDVLANDSTLPYAPPTSFTLTDVVIRPGAIVTNGTASISNNMVRFEAGATLNASSEWLYTATVPNSPVVITGVVSVITGEGGEVLYANLDYMLVRANSSTVALPVLTNDISYRRIQYPLTIQNVSATTRGGTVTISSDGTHLLYTPANGIVGEDEFSYIVSDGTGNSTGHVTVNLIAGDLIANDDAFIVGYRWDPTAGKGRAYALPVLDNDSVFPGGAVALRIDPSFDIGAFTPQYNSSLEVAEDGQTIIFRPGVSPGELGLTEYVEVFTYEVEEMVDNRKQSATVSVTVRDRSGTLQPEAQNDVFVVERNSVDNVLPVTANDFVEPKSPLQGGIIHVTATEQFGILAVSADGKSLLYTPPAGFVGIDRASYALTESLGGSGTATVTIYVGALPVVNDTYSVLFGSTNILDVVLNDPVSTDYAGSYAGALYNVFEASTNGFIEIVGNKVLYIPDPVYRGPDAYPYVETFRYTVVDKGLRLTDATVTITVYDLTSSQASSVVTIVNPNGIAPPSGNAAYEQWRQDILASSTVDIGGADEDHDNDGLSNFAEYVFGGDPTNAADATVNGLKIGYIYITYKAGGAVDIFYVRRKEIGPPLDYYLYASKSLEPVDWVNIEGTLVDTVGTTDVSDAAVDGAERVIATHPVPLPDGYRFFKIVVE